MSEHKAGLSNWTAEQKQLYRDRRNKGFRGQLGYVTVHQTVKDKKGNEVKVPLGNKTGGGFYNRWQNGNAWQAARGPQQAHIQKQHKATSRGD